MEASVVNLLLNTRFAVEMMLAVLIYLIPIQKAPHFKRRLALSALLFLLLSSFVPLSVVKFFLEAAYICLLVKFCCTLTWPDAIFATVCAYVTQHFSYSLYDLLNVSFGLNEARLGFFWLVFPVTLISFNVLFARHFAINGRFQTNGKRSVAMMTIVLVVVLLLSSYAQNSYRIYGGPIYIISHLYSMFCCIFLMWVQVDKQKQIRLSSQLAVQQSLNIKQREQYQLSRENIDIINRKCHDLKHQIGTLRNIRHSAERDRYITEIEQSIGIYDSTLQTGSEELDTILTDKKLYCESHQITLNCVIDGKQLAFMDTMDVYTIFGNAIDNAIECVVQVEDTNRRIISLREWERSGLLLIQIDNYCENKIVFSDGIPITTKSDASAHGFGLKSIRSTVEKYGGYVKITVRDCRFELLLSIPLK